MNNLTIKQFRYFEALAQHSHFGRAADACGVTQPALSMQIKLLEEDLGAVLFERGARQVQLTQFGMEFASRVRDILRLVDELSDLARASQTRLVGRVRVGVIPTIAPYLLPRLVQMLSELYPELELYIRETLTANLIHDLADGRLDTAIVALPVSEPSLSEVPIFDENFVLVRSKRDADQPVPSLETLQQMRLLLLEEGHCFRDQALAFCNLQAAHPKEIVDGTSLSTLVQMVGAGIGVTLVPEMAVAVETRSAPVSVVGFGRPRPKRTIGMVWRRTSPMARQLQEIAEIVGQAAGSLRSHPTHP